MSGSPILTPQAWISNPMSGHSKWSQIKHKKGAADAKKSVLFGKIAQAIAAAAQSGSDPATNFRLRDEIERARKVNMARDSIERAIERGARTTTHR